MAARAKSEGKQEIKLGPYRAWGFTPASFEAAYHEEAVFLVTVQSKTSFISHSGDFIWTLYKARIDENISGAILPSLQVPAEWIQPPVEAVDQDTLLIRTFGGAVTLDGVRVISDEQPAALQIGKEYVVWVSFVDFPKVGLTRISELNMGKSSVFSYNPADDSLSPVDSFADARNPVSLETQILGSLSNLRKRLAELPPSKLSQPAENR